MTMSPDEFERLQYTRVSAMGYDLVETGNDNYPYRVEKQGTIVRDKLRSIQDVTVWVDYREDDEASSRAQSD